MSETIPEVGKWYRSKMFPGEIKRVTSVGAEDYDGWVYREVGDTVVFPCEQRCGLSGFGKTYRGPVPAPSWATATPAETIPAASEPRQADAAPTCSACKRTPAPLRIYKHGPSNVCDPCHLANERVQGPAGVRPEPAKPQVWAPGCTEATKVSPWTSGARLGAYGWRRHATRR